MPRLRVHRGGRGLGDDTAILPGLGGSSGLPPGLDASAYLATQVNRFSGDVPPDLQYAVTPFPVTTGAVSGPLATTAVLILLRRATDATVAFGDPATASAMVDAARATSDPVAYVQANLAMVTQIIQQYADAKGLPRASLLGTLEAVDKRLLFVGVGGVVLVVLLTRSRSRKGGR